MDKDGGFIGRDHVMQQKSEKKLSKRLINVVCLDPDVMMYHAEVLLRDGVVVGDIRAASYGHTLGGAVGIAHVSCAGDNEVVNKKYVQEGQWEVDIAGTRYSARVDHLRPFYDPTNERVKG